MGHIITQPRTKSIGEALGEDILELLQLKRYGHICKMGDDRVARWLLEARPSSWQTDTFVQWLYRGSRVQTGFLLSFD